jgi:hypothetical protein
MKASIIAALFALMVLPSTLWGMGQCTKQKLNEIEGGPFIFGDWSALYKSYSKYKVCDNGNDVSEGYSEAVARLLSDHWDKLPELSSIYSKRRGFKKFMLQHIDATVDYNDLQKIRQLSETQCPSTTHSLCAAIGLHVEAAIKESNEVLQKSPSRVDR